MPPKPVHHEVSLESPRLLDLVRNRIRVKHYSIRTEQAYIDWIRRFIGFNGNRHPAVLEPLDIERFLTGLAVDRKVAASTQNQALSAILFLYREVLATELSWLDGAVRAKGPRRLPVVLTLNEVTRLLGDMHGTHRLLGALLYGTGMRIMEALRVRVKDIDFGRNEILLRDGKGAKDRITMLPDGLAQPLRRHLAAVQQLHQRDLDEGFGSVWLPGALARKYPAVVREWAWQYVFPAGGRSVDPRSGATRRHHLSDQSFQRALHQALRDAGIAKAATPHTRGTRSPPTCSNRATTFAPCRNSSAIRTYRRR